MAAAVEPNDEVELMEFDTAFEFVEALRPSNTLWLPPFHSQVRWIFRGQRDATWNLTPSSWREDSQKHPAYKLALNQSEFGQWLSRELQGSGGSRPDLPEDEMERRVASVIVQRHFECTITVAFAELLDELGMPLPEGRFPDGDFWDYFNFVTGPSLCRENDAEVSMIHALAQHHRNPTRLLDWSTNPLYAAFFAASENESKAERIAVWAVHRDDMVRPQWQHRSSGTGGTADYGVIPTGWRIVSYPRHQSTFMHAQSGLFTFFSNAGFHHVETGHWPDMVSAHPPKRIRKLTLPEAEAGELLRILRAEGISKAHLMPHLDSIHDALVADWDAKLRTLQSLVGPNDPVST